MGHYARIWLRRHDLERALADRFVVTEHAGASLRTVEMGHVDLAIVYATDARLASKASLAYEIPSHEQPHIRYGAALIQRSGSRKNPSAAAAHAFLLHLQSPESRSTFERYGFSIAEAQP